MMAKRVTSDCMVQTDGQQVVVYVTELLATRYPKMTKVLEEYSQFAGKWQGLT